MKSFIDEKKIGFLLFILSIIILIITIIHVNRALFIDEVFSLYATNSTYGYAIQTTAMDVHPPLYYIFLKFFRGIFTPFNIDPIIVGNLLSAIPIVLLLIVSITKIRKEFGWITSGIFALCITAMPQFMYHTVSIRMYTFVMFFVTMEYIYAYSLVKDFSLKNWTILTIFAVLASYTHYYGVLASIIIYLLIFLFIIYKKKNQLKNIIISEIIILISYIPWITVIISQLNGHSEGTWINNNFLASFKKAFWDYLSYSPGLLRLFGIILFIIIIFLIIYQIKKYRQDKEIIFAYSGFIIPILTVILAMIISVIVMPMFVPRYIFVVIGCFWLGFSILLSKIYNNKKIFIPILVVLLCVASINTVLYIETANNAKADIQMIDNLHIKNGDILICGDNFLKDEFEKWYAPSVTKYNYMKDKIDYDLIDKTITSSNGNVYVLQKTENQNFDDIPSKYKLELIKTLKKGHKDTLPKYIYKLTLK